MFDFLRSRPSRDATRDLTGKTARRTKETRAMDQDSWAALLFQAGFYGRR